jgi:hypothetical protein
MELGFDREKNRQERLAFVREYALWVRRVPNEVWSREQADLIDAFLANAGNYTLSRARYLEMQRDIAERRRPVPVDEHGCARSTETS